MSMMGVPHCFTEWLSSWSINRRAKMRVNGSIGPSIIFKKSLPQGSTLFTLLFTMYIDDLLAKFNKDTFVSANADDLLIVCSARNKDMIMACLKPEVDKVVAWSDMVRLTLNTSKCEAAFFSMDCAEAAWQPNH